MKPLLLNNELNNKDKIIYESKLKEKNDLCKELNSELRSTILKRLTEVPEDIKELRKMEKHYEDYRNKVNISELLNSERLKKYLTSTDISKKK